MEKIDLDEARKVVQKVYSNKQFDKDLDELGKICQEAINEFPQSGAASLSAIAVVGIDEETRRIRREGVALEGFPAKTTREAIVMAGAYFAQTQPNYKVIAVFLTGSAKMTKTDAKNNAKNSEGFLIGGMTVDKRRNIKIFDVQGTKMKERFKVAADSPSGSGEATPGEATVEAKILETFWRAYATAGRA